MSNQLNPRDIVVAGLTALQMTQYARARQFDYLADAEQENPPGHFGPLAEELVAIDPQMVVEAAGDLGIDTSTVAGIAWAAAGLLGDWVSDLTVRIVELERQLAELT